MGVCHTSTMVLLLLMMLAMGSMATDKRLGPEDFVVLKNDSHPDDIDHNDVKQLEDSNSPQEKKAQMPNNTAHTLRRNISSEHLPHAYKESLRNRTPMFDDDNNGTNVKQNNGRSQRQLQTSLYHCDHDTYLLTWFPYYTGYSQHFCYIPWANAHDITYAHCGMDCDIPRGRRGHCRPCCFHRRVIIAMCVNVQSYYWQWRIVERNLPQACRCTSCSRCG